MSFLFWPWWELRQPRESSFDLDFSSLFSDSKSVEVAAFQRTPQISPQSNSSQRWPPACRLWASRTWHNRIRSLKIRSVKKRKESLWTNSIDSIAFQKLKELETISLFLAPWLSCTLTEEGPRSWGPSARRCAPTVVGPETRFNAKTKENLQ